MTEPDAALPAQPVGMQAAPSTRLQAVMGWAVAGGAVVVAGSTWHLTDAPMVVQDGGAPLVPRWCAAALLLCGLWLVWEARHGGWRHLPAQGDAVPWQITPWVWVSAGFLLAALLVRTSGFVVAGALCYVLALQGLRLAAQPGWRVGVKGLTLDVCVGVLLAAVVVGLFTQVLGVALPAGWWPWM